MIENSGSKLEHAIMLGRRLLAERRARNRRISDACRHYFELIRQGGAGRETSINDILGAIGWPGHDNIYKCVEFALGAFGDRSSPKDPLGAKIPMVTHSLELAAKAGPMGFDLPERVAQIALLHDVLEDTEFTREELRTFDLKTGFDLLPATLVLTEEREGLGREQSVSNFTKQIVLSSEAASDRENIALVELVDRIDDLSRVEYIEVMLESRKEETRNRARALLVKKLGKCQFTFGAVAKAINDNPKVRQLQEVFDALFLLHIQDKNIQSEEVVVETKRYV